MRNFFVASVFNSSQFFFNAEGQIHVQCERSLGREGTAAAPTQWIHNERDQETRRGSAFLEVCSRKSPIYVLRCNDRQQELHDLQNTREKYLSNGWRKTEQPLHQQQWVQNEMAKFHSSVNSLEHRDNVLHARKLGLQNRV